MIFAELVGLADELVIGMDDSTTDDTESIARQFTNWVLPAPHAGYLRAAQAGHVEHMLPIVPATGYCGSIMSGPLALTGMNGIT
jgi:hypothetical protein